MKPFRKRFVRILEAELPGPAPALGAAPMAQPAAQPATPAPNLTNNSELQSSLDSTAAAGAIAAGVNPIQKLPEYRSQIENISKMAEDMLNQIKDTAGKPGTALIWTQLNNELSKILTIAGALAGKLKSLPSTVAVKTDALNKQKSQ